MSSTSLSLSHRIQRGEATPYLFRKALLLWLIVGWFGALVLPLIDQHIVYDLAHCAVASDVVTNDPVVVDYFWKHHRERRRHDLLRYLCLLVVRVWPLMNPPWLELLAQGLSALDADGR